MHNGFTTSLIIALLFVLGLGTPANAQFESSTKWVPNGANMIVLVRSSEIFLSDIALAQQWRQKSQNAFDAGAQKIPPTVDRYLIASQMDLEYMDTVWQVSVFESKRPIDLVKISEKAGGNLDTLAGKQSLSLSTDTFLVKIDDKTLASMAPANRQVAVRWIKRRKNSQPKFSDYLSSAIKFADSNAHIIVAFDFEDAINPDQLKEKFKDSELVAEADVEQTCQLLAKMKGITFGVTFNNKVNGAIKVDFSENPEFLAGKSKGGSSEMLGKELLIAALKTNGLMIDDLEDWKPSVKNNQFLLSGSLSPSGLRHINLLIEQPLESDFGYEPDESVDSKTRSIQYFRSVEVLVSQLRNKKSKSLKTYARWFDKYARSIDELSVLDVDQVLVDFGQSVSDGFRDISAELLGGELNRMSTRINNSYGYRGYRNRYYYRGNIRIRENVERMESGNRAQKAMRAIDSSTARVRKELAQKYGVDF